MRNAKFADIMFEMAWFIQNGLETSPDAWGVTIPDPATGQDRLAWQRIGGSPGWAVDLLLQFGVVRGRDPYYFVERSAKDFARTDFSRYDTLDCYVEAMWALSHLPPWPFDSPRERKVGSLLVMDLDLFSPAFRVNIAERDDMFAPFTEHAVLYDETRFKEKVIQTWEDKQKHDRFMFFFQNKAT